MTPETSTTLLRDLARDSQHARWTEFVARYRPMMEAYMRERFPSVEADDVIQETLIALGRVLPNYRYAPDEKGRFRNYLTGILRTKAMRQLRGDSRRAEIAAAAELSRPQDAAPAEDQSWREAVFALALGQFLADDSVADRTKRIFERVALNGEPPEVVAASFKMKRHAVDQAKSRALARLREIVKSLEGVANG